jgi:hypothetical protein
VRPVGLPDDERADDDGDARDWEQVGPRVRKPSSEVAKRVDRDHRHGTTGREEQHSLQRREAKAGDDPSAKCGHTAVDDLEGGIEQARCQRAETVAEGWAAASRRSPT